MKIIQVHIQDFLGLANVKIKAGKFNTIKGGNGVGKTSILKAIQEAFKKRGHDAKLIRKGANQSEIYLQLDNGMEVSRIITEKENKPKVVVDGETVSAPLEYLSKLIGPFQFNPVDFFQADDKTRRNLLLRAMPLSVSADEVADMLGELADGFKDALPKLDYSEHGLVVINEMAKSVYEQRAEVNRDRTRIAKAIEQEKREIPAEFDLDKYADFDIQQAAGELATAENIIENHERDQRELDRMRRRSSEVAEEIETLEARLQKLKEEREELVVEGRALAKKVDAFEPPETESLRSAIAEYKKSQSIASRLETIQRRTADISALDQQHEYLDSLHRALSGDVPKQLLAKANMPIEGLQLEGDAITIDGTPIDSISTSEQMRLAIDIARALSGNLRVICIDRYESLDEDARKAFEDEAEHDDYEYFITQVTGGELSLESRGENNGNSGGTAKPKTAAAAKKQESAKAGF